jgi:hypothetical protein
MNCKKNQLVHATLIVLATLSYHVESTRRQKNICNLWRLLRLPHYFGSPFGAFDSISHKFIYSTLKTLNFGRDIIGWIRTFLLNRTAQILIGGNLTDKILLEQGVPQGDIISPQLFILMVEILLIKITKRKNIEGIVYQKPKYSPTTPHFSWNAPQKTSELPQNTSKTSTPYQDWLATWTKLTSSQSAASMIQKTSSALNLE